jgi:hypothetical protein
LTSPTRSDVSFCTEAIGGDVGSSRYVLFAYGFARQRARASDRGESAIAATAKRALKSGRDGSERLHRMFSGGFGGWPKITLAG